MNLWKILFTLTIGEYEVSITHVIPCKSYEEAWSYGNMTVIEENAWSVGYDEPKVKELLDIADNGTDEDIADVVSQLEEMAANQGKVWVLEDLHVFNHVCTDKESYIITLEVADEV